MAKDKTSDIRKKIIKAYEENEYANVLQNRNRARSLNVGTAFGGIVEVSMRGDYHHLWCTLQPVEVVEIIEQLAASAGLQIAIRPRHDFATWRGWDTDADHKYWAGAAHWQLPPKEQQEEEQKLLESKETKKLPQSKKKKSVVKSSQKKIIEMNEKINQQINDIRENIINDVEEYDKNRIKNIENMDNNINLTPAVEHIDDMREILMDEYNKDVREFSQLLGEKYGD